MEATPWRSEFAIDENVARLVIQEQFPGLPVETVEYLHEGWDSRVFLVNAEWVFRFPKRREVADWLPAELRTLELLRHRKLGIPIPEPEFAGRPCPHFPAHFVGYRLIVGTPGDRFDRRCVRQNACARQLGRFLSTLHTVDSESVNRLGVRTYENSLDQLLEEVRELRETILLHLPARLLPDCRRFLEVECTVPADSIPRSCLIHSDLGAEHLLLDAEGEIAGVIDWGDVCIGDPALDFAGIGAWLGEPFVRQVLAHYALPWNEAFVERIAFAARCIALANFGWSLKGWEAKSDDQFPMIHTAFGVPREER